MKNNYPKEMLKSVGMIYECAPLYTVLKLLIKFFLAVMVPLRLIVVQQVVNAVTEVLGGGSSQAYLWCGIFLGLDLLLILLTYFDSVVQFKINELVNKAELFDSVNAYLTGTGAPERIYQCGAVYVALFLVQFSLYTVQSVAQEYGIFEKTLHVARIRLGVKYSRLSLISHENAETHNLALRAGECVQTDILPRVFISTLKAASIARAIFRESSFVLLDEPTGTLDPLAETEILKSFIGLSKDRTAIIISHRVGLCRYADKILMMENGKLIEEGSYEQPMRKKGAFFRMFQAQAQYYE